MYHASLLPEWRLIDILGVYAVLFLALLLGLVGGREQWRRGGRAWCVCSIVWGFAIIAGIYRNDVRIVGVKWFHSTYVFVAAIACGGVLALAARRRATDLAKYFRGMLIFVGAAALSFVGGIGDRFGSYWTFPEAFLQGHTVWHVGGAIALLGIYEVFTAADGDERSLLQRRE